MLLMVLAVSLAAIAACFHYFIKRRFEYWSKRNVPHVKPTTIFGNYKDAILIKRHATYVVQDLFKKFPGEPYIGAFLASEPTLIVQDAELVKLITTKDFYYFNGREISKYTHMEEFNRNLFFTSGDYWRVLRQNLTPVFTTAKMKKMFPLIVDCAFELETMIDAEVKMSANELKIQKLAARYTMACIVSCAFGIDSGTMTEDYKNNNPFIKISDVSTEGSILFIFITTFRTIWPAIFYSLGLKVVPNSAYTPFKKLLGSIFKSRNYQPSSRNDFIDFVLNFKSQGHIIGDKISNLKTGKNEKVQIPVTDDLIMAQSLLFFLAGYETSSTTIGHTMYALAKNPEIQKKVQAEVDAYLLKHGNKLTYDIITELPYTWACVEESLRLNPIVTYLTREVMEDYTLPTGLALEKGVRIHIAVREMHYNPKYFPDPDVYRPERFLGDERQNIVPCSYMGFGEGSRICIGTRFAKMQVLAGIVTVMKKYNLEMTETTPRNLVYCPKLVIPSPQTPLTLKATPRPGWETRLYNKE